MSRIGKKPVAIPDGVKIEKSGNTVKVTGPKGKLTEEIHAAITVTISDAEVTLERPDDLPANRALHGLSRALIANMIVGVTQGYEKILEIVGVGYRANVKGKTLNLQVGHSHPVAVEAPDGVEFSVDGNTTIKVAGIDKQKVGQAAANIRAWRKPEPYKGKGIRYRNEHVRRKAGKAGA
ncbi:MAG: 50S ribosomal protein L6 [Candidatus Hydrogenedentota bacterium]